MSVYYKIHRLSARLVIGYARQENDGRYSFSLSAAATKKCILQGTEAQEDNALFYQIMRQLNLDTAYDDYTICADLENVIFFMDFSGIFDCGNSDKAALRHKKVEDMFSSEGITLDFGGGPYHYLPFERSSSMSRESRLSFIRADLYEPVRQRIMLDMRVNLCQLSKLYAYNGLMLTSGKRIEGVDLTREHCVIVVDNETYQGYSKIITVKGEEVRPGVKRYHRVESNTATRHKSLRFDGEGLISTAFSEQIDRIYCGTHPHHSFQIRLPFVKGMVHEVDFKTLLKKTGKTIIQDIWGLKHPVDQVEVVLTKSMFKGFGWLTENGMSWADYWSAFDKYEHALYISGVSKEEPQEQTQLNYQFLATLSMTAEEFRPADLPLGWDHSPSKDARDWITKATEQRYYDLCCNEQYRYEYFARQKSPAARVLKKNPLFIHEPVFTKQLEDMAERTLKDYTVGRLWVSGDVRYLSGDLLSLVSFLVDSEIPATRRERSFWTQVWHNPIGAQYFYAPQAKYQNDEACTILRNPHISRNEELQLKAYNQRDNMRQVYLSHLSDVVMVDVESMTAERLGGADYDGDMVKTIADPIVKRCVARHSRFYEYSTSDIPFLLIPAEEAVIRDANDWHDRYVTIRDTFSTRVGQICNAAFNRSVIAYDENSAAEDRERCRMEVEILSILSGLEIDSAKTGVKPDLDDYLKDRRYKRSGFLKYKELLEEDRSTWKKRKRQIEATDWSAVSSNVERLPYFAYMLEKYTPKLKSAPASDEELFRFAVKTGWRENLDGSILSSVSVLLQEFEACLSRIRACKAPIQTRRRESDISRILYSRGQEDIYDVDELYSLFSDFDVERIVKLRTLIRDLSWHFMRRDERIDFLEDHLPECREHYDLLADFRAGGYRVLADLVCDIDDENKATERKQLHREQDSDSFSYMMTAYEEKTPDLSAREAVSAACQTLLREIVDLQMAVRYIVALGKRNLLWDIVPEQIEREVLKKQL